MVRRVNKVFFFFGIWVYGIGRDDDAREHSFLAVAVRMTPVKGLLGRAFLFLRRISQERKSR